MKSLAEHLGVEAVPPGEEPQLRLEDINDPTEFAKAVLNSYEFRRYIVNMLILGELPSAVLLRVMDLAGWQAPPKKIELSGANGGPIQTVSEVRRVLVRPSEEMRQKNYEEEEAARRRSTYTTH